MFVFLTSILQGKIPFLVLLEVYITSGQVLWTVYTLRLWPSVFLVESWVEIKTWLQTYRERVSLYSVCPIWKEKGLMPWHRRSAFPLISFSHRFFFVFQASDACFNLSFFWTSAMVTDLISGRERKSKGNAVVFWWVTRLICFLCF